MAERIQKVLANMGLGSRREIERWIAQGLIHVDGRVAQLGQTDEGVSEITVDGRKIVLNAEVDTQFLQYHKPSQAQT